MNFNQDFYIPAIHKLAIIILELIVFLELPSIETQRQYFAIGDFTTWGWCINLLVYFLLPWRSAIFDNNVLPILIYLSLALDAPYLQTAVLCLTYDASESLSVFLSLGFIVVSDLLGFIRLLSLFPSGVETISTCTYSW